MPVGHLYITLRMPQTATDSTAPSTQFIIIIIIIIIIIVIIIIMVVVVDRTRELIIMPWLVILPRSSHRLTKLLTSTEFAGAEEARPHQGQLHRAEGRDPQPAGQAGGQVQQGSDPQKGGKYLRCVTNYISDTCQ